jgi:hypothetical protein
MTDQTTQTGDAPAEPAAGAAAPAPGNSAADWAEAQEASMHRMIDKMSDVFSQTMSEPTTRLERIATALLGDRPPDPNTTDVATYAPKLVALAHAIHTELLKLEADVDPPTVAAAAEPAAT